MGTENKNNWSELMRLAQSGDGESYKVLLSEIGLLVLRRVKRFIRKEADVEEVYQEVLLTIHRARHTFDPSRKFEPWLYTIIRNTVYDFLRKNRRKFEAETLVGDFFAAAPEDSAWKEEQILSDVLGKLPEAQREAVEMIKIQGLSMEQAAEKAGISISAIKVRAHRGYERLKTLIMEYSLGE